jgi:hypothetical protein
VGLLVLRDRRVRVGGAARGVRVGGRALLHRPRRCCSCCVIVACVSAVLLVVYVSAAARCSTCLGGAARAA